MKNILGLDLGTNSIGWAVIEGVSQEEQTSLLPVEIKGAGSRIIPMSQDILSDFEKGNTNSQTKVRTGFRGTRRLRERQLLRRDRLHRVLNLLGFLPQHYSDNLDRYGHILTEKEPKLAWFQDETKAWCFLFRDSFNEMLLDFSKYQPTLLLGGKKVPYDWTLYFLRKKALTAPLTKYELAWLLLNFNQKRGYYQLRGEDDGEVNDDNKQVEYLATEVVSVEVDEEGNNAKGTWYNVKLANGMVFPRQSKQPLDSWVGQTKEFIVTTKVQKNGEKKLFFSAPKEGDWGLMKIRTEKNIESTGKTVGAYIYDTLLLKPDQKINGKLVKVVERKFYKQELKAILEKQKEFHKELQDKNLCIQCYEELYAHNSAHRESMVSLSEKRKEGYFTTLFIDDILFYQRPLKSKKSLISDCPYEYHEYVKDGKIERDYQKCIAKSHPLFQEFRLLQFLSNLRIIKREEWDYTEVKGKLLTDIDKTADYLDTEEKWERLYNWMLTKKEIGMKELLLCPVLGLGKSPEKTYRWNYVEDKKYPGNETHANLLDYLKKAGIEEGFLTERNELALWEILYSVNAKEELHKALSTFAKKNGLEDTAFVEVFMKYPAFDKEYGSYSAKAIKKLLPLMRFGSRWKEEDICASTKERIERFITGEYDEKISDKVRELIGKKLGSGYTSVSDYRHLPLWQVCYIVYGRHSEAQDITKWETPEDVDQYLKQFKQYSLRNPIVEQVVLETLRTVRDIWKYYGSIDEIHLEMGRDLKNPADKRKQISERNTRNEQDNYRIKALLTALANDLHFDNARAYSPSQQEILRIYEEGALETYVSQKGSLPEDILGIIAKFKEVDEKKKPTKSDIDRYVLWLEQKYCSPYTGETISLSRLFTSDYEIEHVIPQSRYFDDSISNKVICESAVNKLKTNMLGFEFIKQHHGEVVELGNGKTVRIFEEEAYQAFVTNNYRTDALKTKRKKLLMDEIPDGFIERQLNDSRYISKVVKGLLSNIVRTKDENGEWEQEAISKNLITTNGSVTDMLKKAWGINDVWNKIILPRFQRMNKIDPSHTYTTLSAEGHEIPTMPLGLQYGFNKKRIDHRHHAMDAIVIACASRDIVNYLSNESARGDGKRRYDLMHKLCNKKKDTEGYERMPRLPWSGFSNDVYNTLEGIIVSFKQNIRVLNKASNKYMRYVDGKKQLVSQEGNNYAIRKSLHDATVWGPINIKLEGEGKLEKIIENPNRIIEKDLKIKIKELIRLGYNAKSIEKYFNDNKEVWSDINLDKIKYYYYANELDKPYHATRTTLIDYFKGIEKEKEAHDRIIKITDTGIQKILFNYIGRSGDIKTAFSPEGLEYLNANIQEFNDSKSHKPIYSIRRFEGGNLKFRVGQTGNKKSKFVKTTAGTNLYFAIYESKEGKKAFETIPLNIVIENQKNKLNVAPRYNGQGYELKYVLSPNDLVMVNDEKKKRTKVFKVVSFDSYQCFFVPVSLAKPIVNAVEFGKKNKFEKDDETGIMIKTSCIPIRVDRLGHIVADDNKLVAHD